MSEILLTYCKRPKSYNEELAKHRQKKYLKSELKSAQKMELYDCGVKGDLTKLKNLIKVKKYDILEECSASGYYWTVLHYASHYGWSNVINFVLDELKTDVFKKEKLNIQSNLGLTPLMIAINNLTNVEKKKEILTLYVYYDVIDYEVCTAKGEDIIELCKKHNLLDFLYSLLKED